MTFVMHTTYPGGRIRANWLPTPAARRAELAKPPPRKPPELLKATRCRVLRPFSIAGQRVEIGAVVELRQRDAMSMRALGKVEILLRIQSSKRAVTVNPKLPT